MPELTQPIATILGALVTAFLGSWAGAATALSRFRRERAFDRQLDWYERMVRSLYSLGEAIEVAMTFEKEGRRINHFWVEAQKKHLELDRFAREALLYGSRTAITAAEKARNLTQDAANATAAFDPDAIPQDQHVQAFTLLRQLPAQLYEAAQPIIKEARHHLRLSGGIESAT